MKRIKIYKHTNMINGKTYIGQTTQSLERRARKDGSGYSTCTKFWGAIQKYGWSSFKSEILEEVNAEDADNKESEYIKKFNSIKNGYNIALGGHTHKELSLTHRMNISTGMKGKRHTKRHLNMIGSGNPSARPVKVTNVTNEKVSIYGTIKEALIDLSIPLKCLTDAVKVCKNKRKTCHGFRFEYYEN